MRIRPLAYFALLILNIIMLYVQVQLYASPEETITFPLLGYLNVSKEAFVTVLAGSLLMLPYMIILLIGSIAEAEWLYSTRLYCAITALTVEISRLVFLEVFTFWTPLPAGEYVSVIDMAFTYLLAEGVVSVLEGLTR